MELIDSARVPGDAGKISLYKRGEDFALWVDDVELMTSLVHGSEDALAELAYDELAAVVSPVILIGGLGMGYTLAAALKHFGPGAAIEVAELLPAVVAWNHGPLGPLAGHPLKDGRVTVREGDVARFIRAGRESYDAVLLDVDNGPEGLVRGSNDWLYGEDGLSASFAALRPGGLLAVWSAGPDPAFRMRLQKIGFRVREARVKTDASPADSSHRIWIARRPAQD